ncbi:hypothetical protein HY967_00395 [Candidatus Jorgensenbacteria bacterium]|nr:hypothetical protein [Candidatus Jorgensenbacteria bacterium]
MRQKLRNFLVITISSILAFSNFSAPFSVFSEVSAATPTIISYQGRLQDSSGNVLGGSGTNYNFRFSIWNTSTVAAGTQIWPSSTPATITLTVRQGLFEARLGDSEQGFSLLDFNFNTSSKVYLQVEVYNTTSTAFETLSPRQPIVSSGFAVNADTVDGAHAGTSANNVLLLDPSGGINLPSGSSTFGGPVTINGVTALQGFTFSNATGTGNFDIGGVIQAGSSNVNLTLATGFIDADAITFAPSASTTATSSVTGLQTISDGLTLIRGCASGELLKWNLTSLRWECSSDVSGTGGSITIERNDTLAVQTSTIVDFSSDFSVTESPSNEANVSINYASSSIARTNQNETVVGRWTFSTSTIISATPQQQTTSSLFRLGPNEIVGGSASGTFLAANPTAFNGNFIDFQVNSSTKFKVDGAGVITISGLVNSGSE